MTWPSPRGSALHISAVPANGIARGYYPFEQALTRRRIGQTNNWVGTVDGTTCDKFVYAGRTELAKLPSVVKRIANNIAPMDDILYGHVVCCARFREISYANALKLRDSRFPQLVLLERSIQILEVVRVWMVAPAVDIPWVVNVSRYNSTIKLSPDAERLCLSPFE